MSKNSKKPDIVKKSIDKNALTDRVNRLQRENKKLRSENKTLRQAWEKTQAYLEDVVDKKSIDQILAEVDRMEKKVNKKCPSCQSKKDFSEKVEENHIAVYCGVCGYRNIFNEQPNKEDD